MTVRDTPAGLTELYRVRVGRDTSDDLGPGRDVPGHSEHIERARSLAPPARRHNLRQPVFDFVNPPDQTAASTQGDS